MLISSGGALGELVRESQSGSKDASQAAQFVFDRCELRVLGIVKRLLTCRLHQLYDPEDFMLDAFADLAVEAIDGAAGNETMPVAGPNDWPFLDLVRAVHAAVGSRARIVHAPAAFALAGLKVAGLFLRDVVLTPDEVKGLTREYLYVEQPLRRGGDFAEWLAQPGIASRLGRRYESELARHFRL